MVIAKNSRVTVMAGVLLAMMLSAMDQTIVSTALPTIVKDLNGLNHFSWVFTAYMLTSAVTVPVYGKLSDIYGRRGFFLAGIVIFLTGSILCGISQSMTQLIFFRGFQGIGGGALMVQSISVIGDLFPPSERGRWQGLIGGIFGLASIAGPLLGGWITDNSSWRWVFYINVPLGIAALSVIAWAMPKIVPDIREKSIDYAGAVLLMMALVPLLLALVWGGGQYEWTSPVIVSLFIISAVSAMMFGLVERRAVEPILPLSLFYNRVFSISVLATFLSTMALFGTVIYIPLFAQGVVGVSATNSGLILAPLMVGLIAASAISGQIVSRTGKYKWLAVAGMAITTLGMVMLSRMTPDTSPNGLRLNMIVTGAGLGVTMPIFMVAVQSAFEHSRLGQVTASTQLFRSIGGTVGTAILGGMLNSRLSEQLAGIGDNQFVQAIGQMNPQAHFDKLDVNALQGLMAPEGQAAVKNMILQAPPDTQSRLSQGFADFLGAVKLAFSSSISYLFIAATVVMILSLAVVLFLPEIGLRTSNRPAIEEIGSELEAELGNIDADDEPDLTGTQENDARPGGAASKKLIKESS